MNEDERKEQIKKDKEAELEVKLIAARKIKAKRDKKEAAEREAKENGETKDDGEEKVKAPNSGDLHE